MKHNQISCLLSYVSGVTSLKREKRIYTIFYKIQGLIKWNNRYLVGKVQTDTSRFGISLNSISLDSWKCTFWVNRCIKPKLTFHSSPSITFNMQARETSKFWKFWNSNIIYIDRSHFIQRRWAQLIDRTYFSESRHFRGPECSFNKKSMF